MIIVRSPLRISLFGGSTDYASFYKENGAFLIGATINKHAYLSMRYRSSILSKESIITYSKTDIVKTWDEIKNPLIRETLKFKGVVDAIDFNSFSDIPTRTGLGGSSTFCVGLIHIINKLLGIIQTPKEIAKDAIKIERNILKEAGGIQDQIWPAYGGLRTIEINRDSDFSVKPLAITPEFSQELQNSMLLIYTNDQREQDAIAMSHEVDNSEKLKIKGIAEIAHNFFLQEDIKSVGELLYESWKEKRSISNLISTSKIDNIIKEIINNGAYGAKLLGSGGCGFILTICNSNSKERIKEKFKDNVMDFKFDHQGVTEIFST